MTKTRIGVADTVFPTLDPAAEVLAPLDPDIRIAETSAPDDILKAAREAEIVLVTFAKLDAELIAELENCRVIGRFGTGVDNIDLDAATKRGIQVVFCPFYCVDEVSDHALALLLSLARKVVYANTLVQSGRWEAKALQPIRRIRGRKAGLVGFGKIPQILAPKLQALGAEVLVFDPFVAAETVEKAGVRRVEFEELLEEADYISIHAPLTESTHHLFSDDAFARMKPEALLVNTARGPLVDESALARALDSGAIAGAALDVTEEEPLAADSPLRGRDNVILTPHGAFYSEDALMELQTTVARDVLAVMGGKAPQYPANRLDG